MKTDFSKYKNARKVTFKKDFKKGKKTFYKKGETHYIHSKTVDELDLSKFGKVEEVDFDGIFRRLAQEKRNRK